MPASMQNLSPDTPMGATLVAGGATFRVWAPGASEVHVVLQGFDEFEPGDATLLTRDTQGRWAGFVMPVVEGQRYMFHVTGTGGASLKRDPYARELTTEEPWRCIVRGAEFTWHETGYRTPDFADLVIYQLHVGAFFAPKTPARFGTFLDGR